jgi:D-alanyl-lipoteichoic acid acyltransferase DltB (MBOAT superfamily)
MGNITIDLFTFPFWLTFGLAVVLLRSVTSSRIRPLLFTAINIGFVTLILKHHSVFIVVGLLLFWILVKLTAARTLKTSIILILGAQILGLFVLHKLLPLSLKLGFGGINPLLASVGFSYLALRAIELIRGVYEQRHPPPDFFATVNYLVPFHMLAAGPIQSFDDFMSGHETPQALTLPEAIGGAERIAWGMFKKYVLAFFLDRIFLTGFTATGPYFFLEAQLFFLWVYLDFSAYSDIAVGVGRLIGVTTPENFNKPYLARNMIDFWERWHISLALFIRHNLFIPIQVRLMRLTQTQKPLLCASLAFTVSFALCGLWHDVSLRFFLWGAMHALGLVICNLYKNGLKKWLGPQGLKQYLKSRPIRVTATLITYEFVAFSLVIVGYPFAWA